MHCAAECVWLILVNRSTSGLILVNRTTRGNGSRAPHSLIRATTQLLTILETIKNHPLPIITLICGSFWHIYDIGVYAAYGWRPLVAGRLCTSAWYRTTGGPEEGLGVHFLLHFNFFSFWIFIFSSIRLFIYLPYGLLSLAQFTLSGFFLLQKIVKNIKKNWK